MQIPEYLFLWQYKIYTLFIFMAVGVLFSSFVVWFEGKRDGFDEEHLFLLPLALALQEAEYIQFLHCKSEFCQQPLRVQGRRIPYASQGKDCF